VHRGFKADMTASAQGSPFYKYPLRVSEVDDREHAYGLVSEARPHHTVLPCIARCLRGLPAGSLTPSSDTAPPQGIRRGDLIGKVGGGEVTCDAGNGCAVSPEVASVLTAGQSVTVTVWRERTCAGCMGAWDMRSPRLA
jgi:hypothetical protein